MKKGEIVKVAGPLVVAKGVPNARMFDMVKVSHKNLMGEIIELKGDEAAIQVYEETGGVGPGEPVESLYQPLSVELGPGLLTSIYDGVQRPLDILREKSGDYISRGLAVPGLDREKLWEFSPQVRQGQMVEGGDILGEVQETKVISHRVLVPTHIKGEIKSIEKGKFKVEDTVAVVKTTQGEQELNMFQSWPVRAKRPYKRKLAPEKMLVTGQRVMDAFFPLAKGGTACLPGPFGSGKTVLQHQLAKWSDAQIIVYVGCGERGNEMTAVLREFPELTDPYSGEPLLNRTVLIANTSNMPVAAREASIYTGITIAEYFRDMGYHVALMADSTSRWAEALREISGRLEEMPGEEGYPAYLASRVAEFYERAGRVQCLGQDNREGTVSAIGSVSPPGGDLADPVVQATLKVVKVFWSLEDKLAYQRHFPAINWLTSYSLYLDQLEEFYRENFSEEWENMRRESMRILQEEDNLREIVRLIGMETLSPSDRLTLETAKSIREDFLHQIAFDEVDTFTSLKKQYRMLKLIFHLHRKSTLALEKKVPVDKVLSLKVREDITGIKRIPDKGIGKFEELEKRVDEEMEKLMAGYSQGTLETTDRFT